MTFRFGLPRRTAVEPKVVGLTEPVESVSMEAVEPKVVWSAQREETLEPNVADPAESIAVTSGDAADDAADGAPAGDAVDAASLVRLSEYRHAVLSWVASDAYPVNVDVEIEVKASEGIVRFVEPAGFKIVPGSTVGITGSHVHPLPEGGFDERRHITVWGVATARPRGRFVIKPNRVWAWDERDLPLPAAYQRGLPKARRYYEALSAEGHFVVRPKLSPDLFLYRMSRAPFMSATFVPVLLGLVVAARVGFFDVLTAVVTLLLASVVHLGLNVANGVFDTLQGADRASATPTKSNGGSGVQQNAVVAVRGMPVLAVGCYVVAAVLGLLLLVLRGSPAMAVVAALGLLISVAYLMPSFKLVQRGLGEIAAAIAFGPVMLLGAYIVQSRGSISLEAVLLSLPVAVLAALILYVNETHDRAGDIKAGKRTLPVRLSSRGVIRTWDVAAATSFVVVVAGVVAGQLPLPGLLILLAIPLALRVHAGLARFHADPDTLSATMATNIQLHLAAGILLFVGYLLTIADQAFLGLRPFIW